MKTCTKCHTSKELVDFYFRAGPKGTRVPRAQCKSCTNRESVAYAKEGVGKQNHLTWKQRNPERRKMHTKRAKWKSLGINPDLAEAYYLSHAGLCEICNQECTAGRDLAMDHCHKTGAIRGMLCQKCNIALGHFQDSPELLARAIAYLTKPGAVR